MTYIPEELIRSTPREVELTGWGRTTLILALLLALGALGGGAWLYAQASGDVVRARNLRLAGATAEGEVVRIQGPRHKHPDVTVYYRYSVDGHQLENHVTLPRRDRDRFRTGQAVLVRYLEDEPGFSSLENYAPRTTPMAAAIAVPLVLAAVAAVLVLALNQQRRYVENGLPAIAKVNKVEKRWAGKHRTNRVEYYYNVRGGEQHTGRYQKNWRPPQPGTEFVVLYLPDAPHRSIPYPASLVRVSGI